MSWVPGATRASAWKTDRSIMYSILPRNTNPISPRLHGQLAKHPGQVSAGHLFIFSFLFELFVRTRT